LARDHFGADPFANPACRIKAGEERGLVKALRDAEDELARYRLEDSNADRRYYAQRAEHAVALRRAEEDGYAKGVTDARIEAQPIVMAAAKFVREGLPVAESVWPDFRRAFERYPICSDCPGWSYGDKTRCQFCPRREQAQGPARVPDGMGGTCDE